MLPNGGLGIARIIRERERETMETSQRIVEFCVFTFEAPRVALKHKCRMEVYTRSFLRAIHTRGSLRKFAAIMNLHDATKNRKKQIEVYKMTKNQADP